MRHVRLSALTLPALLALLALGLGPAALAQTSPPPVASPAQRHDIAPAPLAQALQRFAGTAGILLSSDASLTEGRHSAGLRATVTPEDGLRQLLAGSGLTASMQADGSYIVRQAGAAAAGEQVPPHVLPPVLVRAARQAGDDGGYRPLPSRSTLHADLLALETAQVVNVVPAQVLRDQRPRNLDDALNNVSGVTQGNTLAGTQDTIMKRGFGANRDGSIMRNGMPLVQGRGMNAAADSVEVLKGPASLLYGIMDPGGVINVIGKKPLGAAATSLTATGSGHAGGKRGAGMALDSTGPLGRSGVDYRLIVDQVDEAYWRNFGRRRETLLAPSLAWHERDTSAVLSYERRQFLAPFDRGTALDPGTNRVLTIPATRRLDEHFNNMRGRSELAQLTVEHRLNPDWQAHLGLSYNRETYDANQVRITGVDTVKGTLARSNDATHGALSSDAYGMLYLQGLVVLAGLRHDVQFGIDREYRRIFRADLLRQASTSTFSYLAPVYGAEQPSTTVSASDSDQSDQLHNGALFVQDSIELAPRWILALGVRYQAYRQVAGRGRPFTTNTRTDSATWLPRAGLVHRLAPHWSLYGGYTASLKPAASIAPLSGGMVIDSTLAPEQARSWEIGAKFADPDALSASVALFNIDKKKVLVSQFNEVSKLNEWHTAGAARSRGLEFDVTGRPGRGWDLIGAYAWIDARATRDPLYQGYRLWNVARQTAALSLARTVDGVAGGQLRLGGGAHHVGKRAGDSANSFDLPAFTTVDAFASLDTTVNGRALKFQINLKNLFDRAYYPSSANRYFISVGEARQLSLLATLAF